MVSQTFKGQLVNLINAGFPYIYIPTYEESRAQQQIIDIVLGSSEIKTARELYVWTQTEGFVKYTLEGQEKKNLISSVIDNTKDPIKALNSIEKNNEPAIYIMKDMHVFFGSERGTHPDFVLIRRFRDIITSLQQTRENVIFISPNLCIPCDMEKDITVLDFQLPDEEEILNMLEGLCEGLTDEQVTLDKEGKEQIARAALGLTMQEAENAFCRAIVSMRGLHDGALKIIHDEKNQVVKKTGVLEFVKTDLGIDDIGGLDNLKHWLVKRNNTWSEKARAYNLPSPKGVLITGVPGCGKSLTAKAMSAIWGLPLLKLDMGKIFGGLVGSSEENMRKAIATAEAIAPSILWVDEIEKGLSGVKSTGDSGTSARVFGTFLTWLQDKEKPVFVIATANDISALPPELLRKGRFDEIFFVDLPTVKERQKIFKLHIQKRIADNSIKHEIKADDETALRLAKLTEGYTGSEIEQLLVSAMYEAFYQDRGLTEEDVVQAINNTVALSTTQREQMNALREWAKERAVLATAVEDQEFDKENDSENTNGKGNVQGGRIVSFDL